jgi:phenylacetic acid degradation operon negative regulatory protein
VDPTPRSLVLDLLSTLAGHAAPVRALVAAAALFGLRENSLRVALARLLADGLVERDARGEYRLAPRAAAVNETIRAWRRAEERLAPWSGAWLAVHSGALPRAAGARERKLRARALRLLGLRPFAPGLELRPDNLAGGVAGLRERLAALGFAAAGAVFVVRDLDAEGDARARALHDGRALVRGYRDTRERLARSAARLPDLPRAVAMAESFRLGGAAIRQIVLDPLLPEPIVPAAERRALVEAVRRYDRIGRRAWAGWLGADLPDPILAPAGVRGALLAEPAWRAAEETSG